MKPTWHRAAGAALALLTSLPAATAQDERGVSSPDGKLEFRIGVAQPEGGGLFRLAYQIFDQEKILVDTSFLGLSILNQEPLLGENVGLTGASRSTGSGYRSLVVEYMQNGSLGRRITIEVRAFNDGIAFRYIIPRSTPLDQILIANELTEFAIPSAQASPLPVITELPDGRWLAISESSSPASRFPKALVELRPTLTTRLSSQFEGTTPLICPWRVIVRGHSREAVLHLDMGARLAQ